MNGDHAMHIPDNWTFKDKGIADNFDDHVSEQLPWYPMAMDLATHLARCYLQDKDILVDLGCSTGGVTRSLMQVIKDRSIHAISIDNSREMLAKFTGYGDIELGDMTNLTNLPDFNVAIAFLSIMFTPRDTRSVFIRNLKHKCQSGGVIIIVDKIEPEGGYLGTSISRMSIKNKLESGVNADDILEKELSLCGVQRPTKESMYTNEGFIKWLQVGDFVGYIYEAD